MNRKTIWLTHALGMIIAVVVFDVSGLSAIQSSVGAATVLMLHDLTNVRIPK